MTIIVDYRSIIHKTLDVQRNVKRKKQEIELLTYGGNSLTICVHDRGNFAKRSRPANGGLVINHWRRQQRWSREEGALGPPLAMKQCIWRLTPHVITDRRTRRELIFFTLLHLCPLKM